MKRKKGEERGKSEGRKEEGTEKGDGERIGVNIRTQRKGHRRTTEKVAQEKPNQPTP